jgi:hypothetical protein
VRRLLRAAILLAAAGIVICVWLFTGVTWLNFFFFMVLVQPLLLGAFVLFAFALLREFARLRASGVRPDG